MSSPRPLLFLDIDDVLCVNDPYGGYDVATPDKPADLWERLFCERSKRVLLEVLERFDPQVVMTTSWLLFLDREGFEAVFDRTGLSAVVARFHEHWEAPMLRGKTRRDAVDKWLKQHPSRRPFAILDDPMSGTGLRGSSFDKTRRVVWCEVGVGLTEAHLPVLERALQVRVGSLAEQHPDRNLAEKVVMPKGKRKA